MRPGIVLDGDPPIPTLSTIQKYMPKNDSLNNESNSNRNDNTKPSINCFAQILLGIKCEINGVDDNTGNNGKNSIAPLHPIISTDKEEENTKPLATSSVSGISGEILETNENEKVVTVKEGLIPDRDEVFLNKPLFISQAVPVPLEVINDKKPYESAELGIRII